MRQNAKYTYCVFLQINDQKLMELTFAREMKAEIVNIRKNKICMFSDWLYS